METFFNDESLDFETQTDIETLLENVKCQNGNELNQEQAFLALASLCSSQEAQNYFYDVGGIEEIVQLLSDGSCQLTLCPSAIFCLACAVKDNVRSRDVVLNHELLTIIHQILSNHEISQKLSMASTFLIACAVSGSGRGQSLILETGCLGDVLKLFRTLMTEDCKDLSHWTTVTQAISFCIGNPQNEKNQNVCCGIIPSALKMVHDCSHHKIIQHILNLIGLIVVNNAGNQNRLRKCGGLDIIMDLLSTLRGALRPRDKLYHEILASVLSALDLCVADNATSIKKSVEMGLVHQIFGILKESDRHAVDISIFLLTLTHLFEHIDNPRLLLLECKGRDWLVKCLTESEEEEVFKAIKYIFILCNNKVEEDNCLTLSGRKMDENDRSFVQSGRMKYEHWLKNIQNASSLLDHSPAKIGKSRNSVRGVSIKNSSDHLRKAFLEPFLPDGQSIKADSKSEKYDSRCKMRAMRREVKPPKCDTFPANSDMGQTCHQTAAVFSNNFLPVEDSRCGHHPPFYSYDPKMDMAHGDGNNVFQSASLIAIHSREKDLNLKSHVNSTPMVHQNSYSERKRTNEYKIHGKSSKRPIDDWVRATQSNYRPQDPEDYTGFHNSPEHNKHQSVHSPISSYQNFFQNKCGIPRRIQQSYSTSLSTLRKDGEVCSKNSLHLPRRYVQRGHEHLVQDLPFVDMYTGHKVHSSEESCKQKSLPQPCQRKNSSNTTLHENSFQETQITSLFSRIQNIQLMISSVLDDIPIGQDPNNLNEDMEGPEENSRWIGKKRSWLSSDTNQKQANRSVRSMNDTSSCHISSGQRERRLREAKHARNSLCNEDDGQTVLSLSSVNFCNRKNNSLRNHDIKEVKENSCVMKNKKDIIQALKSIIALNEPSEDNIIDTHPINPRQPHLDSFDTLTVSDSSNVDQMKDRNNNRIIYTEADSTNLKPGGVQKHNNLRKMKAMPTIHLSSQISEHFVPSVKELDKISGKSITSSCGKRSLSTSRHYSDLSKEEAQLRPSASPYSASFQKDKGVFCNDISTPQSHACHRGRSCHSFPAHRSASSHTAGIPNSSSLLREDKLLPENQGYENQCERSIHPKDTTHITSSNNSSNRPGGSLREKSVPQETVGEIKRTIKSSHQCGEEATAISTEEDADRVCVYDESIREKVDQSTHMADSIAAFEAHHSFHSEVQLSDWKQSELNDTKPLTPQDKSLNRGLNERTFPGIVGPAGDVRPHDEKSRAKVQSAAHPHGKVTSTPKRSLEDDNLSLDSPKSRISKVDGKHELKVDPFDIYQLKSEDESKKELSSSQSDVTPSIRDPRSKGKGMFRRRRIPYTDQEVLNLRHGVATLGTRWQFILNTYQFHKSRTAVDLKEKFKRLMGAKKKSCTKALHSSLPFSKCEIRRLARGVKMFGHNWKAILAGERFLPGRSAQDLRSKWRTLMKKENI